MTREGLARLCTPFDGYSGVYVFHCHMLKYAEHMMIAQFEWGRLSAPQTDAAMPTR